MGFKDSFKNLFFIEDEDELLEEEVVIEQPKKEKSIVSRKTVFDETPSGKPEKAAPRVQRPTGFSVTNPNAFKMLLMEPKSIDECKVLVDNLKGRRPVIVNLERIETETANKIFNFLNGAVYALNGTVQKVSNNIFIFAPENVDISDNTAKTGEGFPFTTEKSGWR